MSAGGFIQRGGWWVVAQNALTIAVVVLAPLVRGDWANAAVRGAGVVLFSLGGWIGVAGVRALGRNRTAFPKPLDDAALVQHGVYGLVRHPLYSSLILASFGWALAWSSVAALTVWLVLTILLDAKARLEERWLREKHPDYSAYAGRVRRLLPWIY